MKISYNWLKQYLDIDIEPLKLSELLTDCGLEIEGLEKYQSVKGGLEGIVIGEIKTCEKHPNADKLSITTVDIGEKNILPIVCGAPNVAAGQKVLIATVGTTLYSENQSFVIRKTKLRGEVSEGMICAEDELGLGTSHEGIMVLDADSKVGTPANFFFNISEDYIFEIGLTPNRSDATSHIGVARDLKAVFDNLYKKNYNLKIPSVKEFCIDNNDREIEVIIEDNLACPRYSGLTISGIKVKESPDWLKNSLDSIGLRPINNIVDITNFVLFETGQPLHAFDTNEITGNKIIIKKLSEGTKFLTLDEVERELTKDDLMICNKDEGMCIAGVFGGINSGVTEKTTNIFLESAYFNPKTIRKTSKHHSLKTDASFRFERGADPEMTIYALKRAALLIKKIAGGKISSNIKDVYPKQIKKNEINISYRNVDRLIGKSIDKKIIKNILQSLEIQIISESGEELKLSIPTYRVDVTREADVIEEILRIYGYNNVEIPSEVRSSLSYNLKPDNEKIQNLVSDYLSNNGFFEIMNNSLTKSEYIEKSNVFNSEKNVNILNPLSKDLNVLRQTLLFGGLESVIYNQNRKIPDLKLYEFGKTYSFNSDKAKEKDVLIKYLENNHLALFITGRKNIESWNTDENNVDFYFLKAHINNIFKILNLESSLFSIENNSSKIFDKALIYKFNNKKVLEFGSVSDRLLKEFEIKQELFYADFNWNIIIQLLKDNKILYKEVSKFPEVRRDLALLINKNIQFADIEKIAFQTESKLLKKVNLFDVYEGKNIEAGKKSYAVSFILQDKEKTLTDKVIDKIMNKMMKVYKHKLEAVIR
ncbi:MAG: phenylalanine--tRNA ligase subunit beta [Bacteroidales bacterium]|nr:phenylalanine--tRNA ligase subunit beta [Bacteroidales bacterium]